MSYRDLEIEKESLWRKIDSLHYICDSDFFIKVDADDNKSIGLVGRSNRNTTPTGEELAAFEGVKSALLPLIDAYKKRYDAIAKKIAAVDELLKEMDK